MNEAEEELAISIVAPGGEAFGLNMGACGDSFFGPGVLTGWPRVFKYSFEEYYPTEGRPAVLVVELSGDSIVAIRHAEDKGWGSCRGVHPLDPVTRHRLIAAWLGVQPKQMVWQAEQSRAIVWKNKKSYEFELGAMVEDERRKLSGTVELLRSKGLLKPDSFNEILQSTFGGIRGPKLSIKIQCEILPCPLDQ